MLVSHWFPIGFPFDVTNFSTVWSLLRPSFSYQTSLALHFDSFHCSWKIKRFVFSWPSVKHVCMFIHLDIRSTCTEICTVYIYINVNIFISIYLYIYIILYIYYYIMYIILYCIVLYCIILYYILYCILYTVILYIYIMCHCKIWVFFCAQASSVYLRNG